MRDAIRALKNKRPPDIYNLSSKVIKAITHIIVGPLTRIFNMSLKQGVFPNMLRVSKIIPVFKKGHVDDVSNYRPIECVPVTSKIFESILKNRLVSYFEESNLFTKAQVGFRSGKSTTEAIDALVDIFVKGFDDWTYTSACFCDLSRAFDCVLAQKLRHYAIPENFVMLLYSHLSNRQANTCTPGGKYSS